MGDSVIWGEGALRVTDTGVSLSPKAMTPSLQGMSDAPEWMPLPQVHASSGVATSPPYYVSAYGMP